MADDDTLDRIDAKICLIGASGVGKTSLVNRYVAGKFNPATDGTIGASFMTKKMYGAAGLLWRRCLVCVCQFAPPPRGCSFWLIPLVPYRFDITVDSTVDKIKVKLQIWDTAGQVRARALFTRPRDWLNTPAFPMVLCRATTTTITRALLTSFGLPRRSGSVRWRQCTTGAFRAP